MSSKLFEGGAGAESSPVACRGAGAAARARPKAGRNSGGDPEDDARFEEAYGRGEAAGAQRAAERLTPVFASLSAVIHELAGARRRVRTEAEASTVELAIAIARRVLHREIATDPEAILGLLKSAVGAFSTPEEPTRRGAAGHRA